MEDTLKKDPKLKAILEGPDPEEAPAAPEALAEQAEPREEVQRLIHGKYREAYVEHVGRLLAAQAQDFRRYQAYRDLRREAEALEREYPEFRLEPELGDPRLVRLLDAGVDLRTAYEVLHRKELDRAKEARSRSEAHPLENGLAGASQAAVTRPDPKALTAKERRQLRRRAARGEEIVW